MFQEAITAYEDSQPQEKPEALDRAILQFRAIIDLIPDNGDPRLPAVVGNLGASLCRRFNHLRQLADLNDGIEMLQRAINLTPEDDTSKAACFYSLASAFHSRFEHLGNLADLDNAIAHNQTAVNLTTDNHTDKPTRLNNLSNTLLFRFERLGDLADIENAIIQYQTLSNLTPDGHPDKPTISHNLAHALRCRFQRLGNLADIDDAIAHSQVAVNFTSDDDPKKRGYLNGLGASLLFRFRRLGNLADINDAIKHNRAALNLTPDDHSDKILGLSNLGNFLRTRFGRLGDLNDINDAITYDRAVVNFTPDNDSDKSGRLNNLGVSLETRFRSYGDLSDLDDAIAQKRAALNLTPDDHPNKAGYLSNLAISLTARFEQLGNLTDLNDAIDCSQTAVNLTPDSHPDKTGRLIDLAKSLKATYHRLNQVRYAEMAMHHLSVAAMNSAGPPSDRLSAAEQWISIASTLNHESLLTAYDCALGLIPLVAWLGLPVVDRHQHLARIGGIARRAAAAAISLEQYDRALEWLEQGRSIVWTQTLHLRTPVDELREVNPELAERLLRISRLLEQGSGQGSISEENIGSNEEQERRYRALTMEWESIINHIRSLPNFEGFLRPPSSHYLLNAARHGPVVVLNISTKRCDALAILPGLEDIIHTPLPNITFKRVTELRDEFKDFLYSSGARSRGKRAAMRVSEEASEQTCARVLAELWNDLIQPVLNSLAFSVNGFQ
jgi:tetratricopeptide (TPR) repeat protein